MANDLERVAKLSRPGLDDRPLSLDPLPGEVEEDVAHRPALLDAFVGLGDQRLPPPSVQDRGDVGHACGNRRRSSGSQ